MKTREVDTRFVPKKRHSALIRGSSNLIIGPPRHFLMESYLTKWGKFRKMVYPRLRYWLLTIICIVGSPQFTSNNLFGHKMG